MKKSRKPAKSRKKAQPVAAVAPTRRSFLASAPYIVGGIIAVGGLGYLGVSTVMADLAEQDLAIVGSGIPVIVQVHDPSCPICLGLQKEARAALDTMDDDALAYRVASITSDTGTAFAAEHRSSHATLLFFDGTGTITQRITGATDRDVLRTAFEAHVAAEN